MAIGFQVVFDCANPAGLAQFWAEVLGYKEQDPPEGFATWQEFLVKTHVPEDKWNTYAGLVDPEGVGARLLFQKVPETKTVKNRVHLDVNVTGGYKVEAVERARLVDEAVKRFIALGATKLGAFDEMGTAWVTMADPENNEFCVH